MRIRNKVMIPMLITLLTVPSMVSAGSVKHRSATDNEFNRISMKKLSEFPQSEKRMLPISINMKVKVRNGAGGEVLDITNRMKHPIRTADGYSLVSITDFAQIFGIPVSWYNDYRTVVIGDMDKFLSEYPKGENKEYVKLVYVPINRDCVQVDAGITASPIPGLIDPTTNRSYLPIRFLSELLNINVHWSNSDTSIILDLNEEQFISVKNGSYK